MDGSIIQGLGISNCGHLYFMYYVIFVIVLVFGEYMMCEKWLFEICQYKSKNTLQPGEQLSNFQWEIVTDNISSTKIQCFYAKPFKTHLRHCSELRKMLARHKYPKLMDISSYSFSIDTFSSSKLPFLDNPPLLRCDR